MEEQRLQAHYSSLTGTWVLDVARSVVCLCLVWLYVGSEIQQEHDAMFNIGGHTDDTAFDID